jgi:hypothetical protein
MRELWDKNFAFFASSTGNQRYFCAKCGIESHCRAIVDRLIVRMSMH